MKPQDMPLPPADGCATVPALALAAGRAAEPVFEAVIDEVPVALQVNGISHVVMLATPVALEDFALGFLLTEGLIDHAGELLDVQAERSDAGVVLDLQVTARAEARFKSRRRSLAGRTGCGLCGLESLDQLVFPALQAPAAVPVASEALWAAMAALVARQPLQQLTGGVHAAAWCRDDGAPELVREDVGRHNALDKLVGAMARSSVPAADGFVVVTSRASYEMVQKALRAGVGLLAAVSAPTHRAVALADRAGLTLAGFVREGRATVYTHPQRIVAAAGA